MEKGVCYNGTLIAPPLSRITAASNFPVEPLGRVRMIVASHAKTNNPDCVYRVDQYWYNTWIIGCPVLSVFTLLGAPATRRYIARP